MHKEAYSRCESKSNILELEGEKRQSMLLIRGEFLDIKEVHLRYEDIHLRNKIRNTSSESRNMLIK